MSNDELSNEEATPTSEPTFDVVALLRRRWTIVTSVAAICCGLSVVYWYVTAPTYSSEAQILLIKKDPGLATTKNQASQTSNQLSEDILATHMQIFQSKDNIAAALKETGLDQLPSIQSQLGPEMTPASVVIENLDVTRGGAGQARTAHVLNVAYRNASPIDSKLVVDALINRYQRFVKEKFEDVNKEAADLIGQVRLELESELEEAESERITLREQNPTLWNGDQITNVHRTRYEQIQDELSTLRLEEVDERARLNIVERAMEGDRAAEAGILQQLALIDDQNLTRLGIFAEVFRSQAEQESPFVVQSARTEAEGLLALIVKERTLRQEYGPRHPEVLATRQQIEVVQEFLAQNKGLKDILDTEQLLSPGGLLEAYSQILRHDLAAMQQRRQELETVAIEEEAAAEKLVSIELKDEALGREVARRQHIYDMAVERLREINLAKDYGGFVNEVIGVAEFGKEVWPSLPLCLALGVFAGFALGVGGAFAQEYFDRSFQSIEETEQFLGLPALAQVPTLKPGDAEQPWQLRDEYVDETICVYHEPLAPQSEVFRGLRTHLFFAASQQDLRVINVTSPKPGDGKSTMTVNLAFSLAQAGRKVLLIDADMRKPRVNLLLGFENSVGLADAMLGEVSPWDVIQPIDGTTVSFMCAGKIPGNPAEILESVTFGLFLDEVKEQFDIVLIDCPPVLKVTDPAIVASRADGTLLALRVSQDSKPEALQARDLLIQNGGNVLGLILNCWDNEQFSTYGGYGYGVGYGYGEAYGDGPQEDDPQEVAA